MRGNELLDKMELIDPAYIEAADTAPNKRKSVWAKWGTLAARSAHWSIRFERSM